jgi:DNA-binding transcriptional LysR family regulator
MNTRDFDLNSLLILNAVIECRSVTAAAQKMSMSPSSITYAINKIRKVTANPIFTRSKNGITPTTLALELNQRYLKAMALIYDGLDTSTKNNTSDISRNITISTYTFLEFWFSWFSDSHNNFMHNIALNFVIHPVLNETRIAKIRNHEVDIDIGGLLPNDISIVSHRLFSSRYKVMVSNHHSTIQNHLTLDDWSNNKHIQWVQFHDETLSHMGDAPLVDEMNQRQIEISSATSLNTFLLCSMSDYLMLVPAYLEDFLTKTLQVRLFELPFETTMTSTVFAHYHRSARKKDVLSRCLEALNKMTEEDSKVLSIQ